MNNVIKKISAIAMAFTLLGTGTAITKSINPESVNIGITADAACSHNMPHFQGYSEWYPSGQPREQYAYKLDLGKLRMVHKYAYYQKRTVYWTCNSCGTTLRTYEYRTYYNPNWED